MTSSQEERETQTHDFIEETFEDFESALDEMVKSSVKGILEKAIREEFNAFIGAGKHQRSAARRDLGNGAYSRSIMTPYGFIEEIHYPRARTQPFMSGILSRLRRKAKKIIAPTADMFLRGISTRKMRGISIELRGKGIGASVASECNKALNEEMLHWSNRPMRKKFLYFFFEGIPLNIKRKHISRGSLLSAVEMTETRWKESTKSLESLVLMLKKRGLDISSSHLAILDGNSGLISVVKSVFREVDIQRCIPLKHRNISMKCPKSIKALVVNKAKYIFTATSEHEARERFLEWRERL